MEYLSSGAQGSDMFITNVGLVTSDGPCGPNIMTAAWVHHISYDPAFVLVSVEPEDATLENILDSREFGIGLASDQQNVLANVAGSHSGRVVGKISLLEELGFEFYKGQIIKAPMVAGTALNIELELLKHESVGSHVILIGKGLVSSVNESIRPMAYSGGRYRKLGDTIEKPTQGTLARIAELVRERQRPDSA